MEQQYFTNEIILSWLQYFSKNTPIDLEKVKMIDITRKNKNLIPTVESHKAVLVFTAAGNPDIFYRMWNAGLGDCQVWYNEGSEPEGEVKTDKLCDMINRGINASAGMLPAVCRNIFCSRPLHALGIRSAKAESVTATMYMSADFVRFSMSVRGDAPTAAARVAAGFSVLLKTCNMSCPASCSARPKFTDSLPAPISAIFILSEI